MDFLNKNASVLIPDESSLPKALNRTTHMAIAAHQDDLEIMAYHGIASCFLQKEQWFAGVTVTDGKGCPRIGPYAHLTDDEMAKIRQKEQEKAAKLGEFGLLVQLSYESAAVKGEGQGDVCDELEALFREASPETVYLHNLADKHDTHVATSLCALQALRRLMPEQQPQNVYGVEVWRDLDWLNDGDKTLLDVGALPHLGQALLGVFDSQISGSKRYDLGAVARRTANAVFTETHGQENAEALTVAMDLKPLLDDPERSPSEFILEHIRRFEKDAVSRIRDLSGV